MEIKDVQNNPRHERKIIRVNIRLTPSQNKFIIENNLSITKIMTEALKQLGYSPQIQEQDYKENFKEERYIIKRNKKYKPHRRRY